MDIIVVNWNSGPRLRHCLESFLSAPGDPSSTVRVFVIDNASTDGSADGLGDLWPHLHVLRNQDNRGFAAACNQGARLAGGDFLLFLNPDSRLGSNSIASSVAYLLTAGNEHVGICGVQLLDQGNQVVRTCMRFPTPSRFLSALFGLSRLFPDRCPGYRMTDWRHDETRTVDAVIGAFFLVRKSVFDALGGFDERFFFLFEEVDFCYRAGLAGWQTGYVTQTCAYHEGSAPWDRLDPWKLYHSARSRLLYSMMHFSPWSAGLVSVGILAIEPFTWLASNLLHGSVGRAARGLGSYIRVVREVPTMIGLANSR